jgi:hypothetical protein
MGFTLRQAKWRAWPPESLKDSLFWAVDSTDCSSVSGSCCLMSHCRCCFTSNEVRSESETATLLKWLPNIRVKGPVEVWSTFSRTFHMYLLALDNKTYKNIKNNQSMIKKLCAPHPEIKAIAE